MLSNYCPDQVMKILFGPNVSLRDARQDEYQFFGLITTDIVRRYYQF